MSQKQALMANQVHFSFPLEGEDDCWPPFSVEGMPLTLNEDGTYKLLVPPLFIKELSVGDSLEIISSQENVVNSWRLVHKSDRSTIWVLTSDANKQAYEEIFDRLRALGCNTVKCPDHGLIAIDVPGSIGREQLENLLDQFSEDDVAYPSYRHED